MTAPAINRRILIPSAIVISVWPLSTAFKGPILISGSTLAEANDLHVASSRDSRLSGIEADPFIA